MALSVTPVPEQEPRAEQFCHSRSSLRRPLHHSPRLQVVLLLLLALVGCSDDKDDGDEVTADKLLAVISATDTDTVPASASASLPGGMRATKLLKNEELQLHDCTAGRLTDEPATASLGWVAPNVGLTTFVDEGVCDVAIANGSPVLCGGGPERFADDPARLETSGSQMLVCAHTGTNLAFLSVVIPSGGAWLAVQQGGLWDVYKVGDRPIVRIMTTEGRTSSGLSLPAKVLDATGRLLADKTLTGVVAG